MKKLIFALVLVFAGMAGFGQERTLHSYGDICEAYQWKYAQVYYVEHCDTLEIAQNKVNTFSAIEKTESVKVNYVEKPYKNEAASAYELVARYYEPEKGDLYLSWNRDV